MNWCEYRILCIDTEEEEETQDNVFVVGDTDNLDEVSFFD